jgi:hypothetical protein
MRLPWDKLQTGPLFEGFLGIGGSAATTDRANELSGLQSQWNVFGQGLNLTGQQNTTGQAQQKQGTQNLNNASDYWTKLLSAGRTSTAESAAPAVDAALAQKNANTTQGAQFGSGRSGGTAGGNQQADTAAQSSIDNIINQNLVGGKKDAAAGLTQIGGTELAAGSTSINQALSALGISGNAGENVATDAAGTYDASKARADAAGQAVGGAVNSILDWAFA